MSKSKFLGSASVLIFCTLALGSSAFAETFDIPPGDLKAALNIYASQAGILVVSSNAVNSVRSHGVKGDMSAPEALSQILRGTGFVANRTSSGQIEILKKLQQRSDESVSFQVAQAAQIRMAAAAGIESVVVTSSKIKGDIQTVPIAITALSQEQLTSRQIAGGPDLVKEVPNLTFSKTNFTGYNIQIRGIGTQAISVTTDPAVAVAFNDIPFIRNHFFEQEFYDVGQVEVLRGPQGTLYGRNATAGVVNIVSAKPTDQFEATLSADIGNFHNRRFEGMVNLPIVDDRFDIRVSGEWTKRDGYSFNDLTGQPIDGRNLWSSRATLGWKPVESLQVYLIWEHFQENDDRIRSSKQLCKTDPGPDVVDGVATGPALAPGHRNDLSQGCLPASLYSAESFEVPNGFSLPYFSPLAQAHEPINPDINPYAETTQSRNLRVIQSTLDPHYLAKNDVVELNADYNIAPALTLALQTGFNHDFIYSTEDYNRFNTSAGVFLQDQSSYNGLPLNRITPDGYFCDPQLGCSNRLVAQDLSNEHAWQLGQEIRLSSNFSGPLNFSLGGNYLHYETVENYYVFINTLTLFAADGSSGGNNNVPPWVPGVSDNRQCLLTGYGGGFSYRNVSQGGIVLGCKYIDPNPLKSLNNRGHNYFLSQNPYVLNSYAGFGEAYYSVASDLKLTGGLRWTADRKHFLLIPSWLAAGGYGYPVVGSVDQKWNEFTGRAAVDWSPKLDFTDQTLVYGSYARGYKAGGANPPGAVLLDVDVQPTHPLTFDPEFVDAFELGAKNTLLDGALMLNGNVFYYNYKGYQISQIVDRTSVNLNFDATVKGAELETTWEPAPGLKFSFAGGYEDTRIADGAKAIDLMDRTAGMPGWVIVRPAPTQASNCMLPAYVAAALNFDFGNGGGQVGTCYRAYVEHTDPANESSPDYPGFDPTTAPNNGEGFDKNLGGNELPNAPHYTASLTAEYTMPVSQDWAATLHGDFYWQSQSFARVFNDQPYDKIRGYSNVNLALILTSADGWQVLGYLKNIFDTTAITGDFLNSDDSGLTTNVFLTDPRLFGVRVTKNF